MRSIGAWIEGVENGTIQNDGLDLSFFDKFGHWLSERLRYWAELSYSHRGEKQGWGPDRVRSPDSWAVITRNTEEQDNGQ